MNRSDYNSNGWHQFGYKQAAFKVEGKYIYFRSYYTNVVIVDTEACVAYYGYAAQGYSATTSKQVTQFMSRLRRGCVDNLQAVGNYKPGYGIEIKQVLGGGNTPSDIPSGWDATGKYYYYL